MIPAPTTTVDLLSPGVDDTEGEDWGGAPDSETGYVPVVTGVRAHLSAPSGTQSAVQEGSTMVTTFRLIADPCDLHANYRIKDNSTGVTYDVAWVLSRGFPIPHVVAGLTMASGTS